MLRHGGSELNDFEAELVRCVKAGEAAAFGREQPSLRANLIRQICVAPGQIAERLNLDSFQVTPFGIEIHNAKIDGNLDLSGLILDFGLRFKNCTFTGQVSLAGAQIRHLEVKQKSSIQKSINLENVLVDGNIEIVETTLNFDGGQFYDTSGKKYHHGAHMGSVLWARDAEIGGSLIIRNCDVRGEIFIAGAEIGGMFDLSGTKFKANGGDFTRWALFALNVEIGGSVYLRGVSIEDAKSSEQGEICFYGANIKSKLTASTIDVNKRKNRRSIFTTIDFSEARFDGDVDLRNCEIQGCLLFRGAEVNGNVRLEQTHYRGANQDGYSVVANDLTVSESLKFGSNPESDEKAKEHQSGEEAQKHNLSKRWKCEGSIDLSRAKINGDLLIDNLEVKGKAGRRRRSLAAPSMQVGGSLLLRFSKFEGAVDLRAVKVGRVVSFHGSQLDHTDSNSGDRFPSLSMRGANVGLDLLFGDEEFAQGTLSDSHTGNSKNKKCFTAKRIRLDNMYIGGNLCFYKAEIGDRLQAIGVRVDGDFSVQDTTFCGEADLSGVRLAKSLSVSSSHFESDRFSCQFKQGLSLYGAVVEGDLRFTKVIFGDCHYASGTCSKYTSEERQGAAEVNLVGAKIHGALILNGVSYLFINAHNIFVGKDMFLTAEGSGFIAYETVRLEGAEIKGSLDCRGGIFEISKKTQVETPKKFSDYKSYKDYCIYAPSIFVGQNVLLSVYKCNSSGVTKSFKAGGAINFSDAHVGRNLDCRGGRFEHNGERCFYAPRIEVAGRMSFSTALVDTEKRFTGRGTIRIQGAKIGGDLDFGGADISENRCKYAIYASGIEVRGSVYLNCALANRTHEFNASGCVRIDVARIGKHLDCRGGKFKPNTSSPALSPQNQQGSKEDRPNARVQLSDTDLPPYPSPDVYSLYVPNIEVGGNVYCSVMRDEGIDKQLRLFEAEGPVSFASAKIGGNFDCRGGYFGHRGTRCLYAPLIEVGRCMYLGCYLGQATRTRNPESHTPGADRETSQNPRFISFKANGTVRIEGAKIGGNLDCSGGHFLGGQTWREGSELVLPYTLYANGANIGGSLYLNRHPAVARAGLSSDASNQDNLDSQKVSLSNYDSRSNVFESIGVVDLSGCIIHGRLSCGWGKFHRIEQAGEGYRGDVLLIGSARIGWHLVLSNSDVKGNINLKGATVEGNIEADQTYIDGKLIAHDVTVKRTVRLNAKPRSQDGPASAGVEVDFSNAEIGHSLEVHIELGSFNLSNATVKEKFTFHKVDKEYEMQRAVPSNNNQGDPSENIGGTPNSRSNDTSGEKNSLGLWRNLLHKICACFGFIDYYLSSLFFLIGVQRFEDMLRGSNYSLCQLTKNKLQMILRPSQLISTIRANENSSSLAAMLVETIRKIGILIKGSRRQEEADEDVRNPDEQTKSQSASASSQEECRVQINLQNASVGTWDDCYVFPSDTNSPLYRARKVFWRMSEEQIKRASRYDLSGFVYSNLGDNLLKSLRKYPREVGLWLNFTRVCQYDPHPYEHMAEVLRKQGDENGYAAVVTAKRREFRQHVTPSRFLRWSIGILIILMTLILRMFAIGQFDHLFTTNPEPILVVGEAIKYLAVLPNWKLWAIYLITLYILISVLFYKTTRILFKTVGFVYDLLLLHFPVHLIARPWRAPAYATLIWLTFTWLYYAVDAKSYMAPSEGHMQYLIAEEKHHSPISQTHKIMLAVQKHKEPQTHSNSKSVNYAEEVPQGYPPFNPALYTFDRLIPLIEFAQSDFWIPDSSKPMGRVLWYSDWFLRVVGFYLVTVLLGSVTGFVKAEKL